MTRVIGYADSTKGYRLYNLKKVKLIIRFFLREGFLELGRREGAEEEGGSKPSLAW